jgi:hypothetical protein
MGRKRRFRVIIDDLLHEKDAEILGVTATF